MKGEEEEGSCGRAVLDRGPFNEDSKSFRSPEPYHVSCDDRVAKGFCYCFLLFFSHPINRICF